MRPATPAAAATHWNVPDWVTAHRQASAAAKLAYLQLWNDAGCQPTTTVTSLGWLSHRLGGSERSARRWLTTLQDLGWIETRHDRNALLVRLISPSDLPTVLPDDTDPQTNFPFHDSPPTPEHRDDPTPAEPPPPPPPQPPAQPPADPPRSSHSYSYSSHLRRSSKKKTYLKTERSEDPEDSHHGENAGETAGDAVEENLRMQATIAAAANLPDPAQVFEAVEHATAKIRSLVPGLRNTPARRVAKAFHDHQLDWETITRIVSRIRDLQRDGTLAQPPWAYFVGAMRREFAKLGIDWPMRS